MAEKNQNFPTACARTFVGNRMLLSNARSVPQTVEHAESNDSGKGSDFQDSLENDSTGTSKDLLRQSFTQGIQAWYDSDEGFVIGERLPQKRQRKFVETVIDPFVKRRKLLHSKAPSLAHEDTSSDSDSDDEWMDKPVVYHEGLTKGQARHMYPKAKVVFTSEMSDVVTHYIFDYDPQVKLFKSPDLYLALAHRIWAVHPAWIKAVNLLGQYPDERLYTLDVIPDTNLNVVHHSKNAEGGRPDEDPILQSHLFMFPLGLSMNGFIVNSRGLKKIIEAAGGKVVNPINTDLKRECERNNTGNKFILATSIGTRRNECIENYAKYGWKTIHPDFILQCVWEKKRLTIPKHLQFTPQMII